MTEIYVNASGPALSFLLYENVKSLYDQEGFLTGEIINQITECISDSQISNQKKETFININSLMPLPNNIEIYDNIGEINIKNLKNFVKTKENEIVGWYSFRRNYSLTPFLRTKLIYKQLLNFLSPNNPELFVMCLLNTMISSSGSTHVFNLKFTRFKHGKLESIPLKILNLGETSQNVYKTISSTTSLSDSFNNIISRLNIDKDKCSDNHLITSIQKSLQEYLNNLVTDIEESELALEKLENEIKSLKESEKLSNEVLLPHLLSDLTEKPSFGTNKKTILTPSTTVIKPPNQKEIPLTINKSLESASTSKVKPQQPDIPNNDPFYYVTNEMKKEMNRKPLNIRNSKENTLENNQGKSNHAQNRNNRRSQDGSNRMKNDRPINKGTSQHKKPNSNL